MQPQVRRTRLRDAVAAERPAMVELLQELVRTPSVGGTRAESELQERLVRDFIGSAGTIRAVRGFRMRKFNLVGDLTTCYGRVTDRVREERPLVHLDIWAENQSGGGAAFHFTLPLAA